MDKFNSGLAVTPDDSNDTPVQKVNIQWPSWNLGKSLWKFFKFLGRIGAGAIVMFALASLVPELREEMPSFYRLIDFIIDAIEWVYTQFWAILT